MWSSTRVRAWRPRRVGALCALALAGCGGGFFVGSDFDGDGFDDDDPPSVELVVSPDTAAPGDTVRLLAAATDDFGIERVAFFRIDGALSTLIDEDEDSPFQLDTALPNSATGTVQFFARATDDAGQSRDSTVVSVSIDP